MTVDDRPLHITGQTKPFADSRESVIRFTLNHLDLPRYLSYVSVPLPVEVPRGQLSSQLELHFVQAKSAPQIRRVGSLQLNDLALVTHTGTPVLELVHANAGPRRATAVALPSWRDAAEPVGTARRSQDRRSPQF